MDAHNLHALRLLLRSARTWLSIACVLGSVACAVGVQAGSSGEGEGDDSGASSSSSSSSSTSSSSSGSTSSGGNDAGNDTGNDGGTIRDAAKDVIVVQPTGCATLIINEVQTAGNNGSEDEFVEIYNPNANPCSLSGWKLVYRSASGTSDVSLYGGTAQVPSGGYVVLGGSTFSGSTQGSLSNALAGASGQLALKDAQNKIVDSVGYGTTSGAFVRGSAAPSPPSAKSIGRVPNGKDTQNNQTDFQVVNAPTPGQAN